MTWYPVATTNDFITERVKTIFLHDVKILLIHLNNRYYAIEDLCTHDGGDLSGGEIEGNEIICPRHGARFCITTGEALTPPAYEDIETFPLKIEGDIILIESEG
ncbi:MAG: non-heme iron oxygenase ferredoxin subunit [Legionellales bacterium]|nr:non-heme iron oxygenase ferredoxin subunit [Legionellales bacterium]